VTKGSSRRSGRHVCFRHIPLHWHFVAARLSIAVCGSPPRHYEGRAPSVGLQIYGLRLPPSSGRSSIGCSASPNGRESSAELAHRAPLGFWRKPGAKPDDHAAPASGGAGMGAPPSAGEPARTPLSPPLIEAADLVPGGPRWVLGHPPTLAILHCDTDDRRACMWVPR
jgi:hypothetical protein